MPGRGHLHPLTTPQTPTPNAFPIKTINIYLERPNIWTGGKCTVKIKKLGPGCLTM